MESEKTQRPSIFHLETLDVRDVMLLYEHLENYGDEELTNQFEVELEDLPSYNLEQARKIYSSMAESTRTSDRETIALLIGSLMRRDPEAALPIWRNLLLDIDEEVACCAYDSMHRAIKDEGIENRCLASLLDVRR